MRVRRRILAGLIAAFPAFAPAHAGPPDPKPYDIVQLAEPYMQARPQEARAYGLKALNRALEGVEGTTVVHICFGYAAIIHERPSGYSFLPELSQCRCAQVSIETAQSNLDCSVLTDLANKKILRK